MSENLAKAIASVAVCAVAIMAMKYGNGEWGCCAAPLIILIGLAVIWEKDDA